MKNLLFFLCCAVTTTLAQTKNVGEQLGYPANAKLLIIHADDLGVSHSENDASIAAMEKGSVNSASIMVPCPWFPEIAAYAAAHPSADFGLHLTLTAEWKYYKWGTVAAPNEVKGLLTDKNYFHDNVEAVVSKASPAEVEKELRAQIERARQFGIDVTHFDTHMGTLLATPEFAKVYIRLGHEYKVPVLLHRGLVEANLKLNLDDYLDKNDVVLDNIFIASPADYKKGMKDFYINVLKTLDRKSVV